MRTRRLHSLVAGLIVTVFLSLSGCYDDPNWLGPGGTILFRNKPTYNIVLVNLSGPEISKTMVYWNKPGRGEVRVAAGGGILPKSDPPILGGKRGLTNVAPHCIPDVFIISWQSPDGEGKRQVISILLPATDRCNFDGEIWLIYKNGAWKESAVTREQEQYRAAKVQSIVGDDQ